MSLSAHRDYRDATDANAARVPGLLPHTFRGTFSANGDFYLYEDAEIRIGYQQSGDTIILIYSPKADTAGGHTSFEKERESGGGGGGGKIVFQAWDGTAVMTAGVLYMVGSAAAADVPPTNSPANTINRTKIGEVVANIALGPTLKLFYEMKIIVHQASAAGVYSYLFQVVKRH